MRRRSTRLPGKLAPALPASHHQRSTMASEKTAVVGVGEGAATAAQPASKGAEEHEPETCCVLSRSHHGSRRRLSAVVQSPNIGMAISRAGQNSDNTRLASAKTCDWRRKRNTC